MNLIKKCLLAIVIILIGDTIKAQSTTIDKLVNSAHKLIVDSSAKYYYLLNIGTNPKFNSYDLKDLEYEMNDRKVIYREIPFQDFIDAIDADTTKIDWGVFNLINVRCVDQNHGPKYVSFSVRVLRYVPYNSNDSLVKSLEDQHIIPVLIKPGMSKKQRKSQEKLAIEKYETHPLEEKQLYRFSKPVFSKNKQYALMGLNNSERGCLYVFKIIDGNWIRILQFRCWVS